jgi:hypothetical protein
LDGIGWNSLPIEMDNRRNSEAGNMTQADATPDDVTVLVPTGMLGAGLQRKHIRRGIAAGAHDIAADCGSTDSGSSYLARGVSKTNPEAIKRDLNILMD